MATSSLLEALRASLTPELISRSSSLIGEGEPATSKALGAALPTLAAALARRSDDPRAMERLYELIDDSANDSATISQSLPSLLSDDAQGPLRGLVSRFLAWLFGERSSALASALSSYAGLRPGSGAKLLSLASLLLLPALRTGARGEAVGSTGLARLLAGQRGALEEGVPAALTRFLGEPARRLARDLPDASAASRAGTRWLWPLLALLAVAALWALLRRPEEPRIAERERAIPTPPVAAAPPSVAELTRRALPGGTQLSIPVNGLEQQLIVFIEDPSRPLDDRSWFNFDRLLFETDSAQLKPESRAQLADVAAILKAYPGVHVKIGGYTDNQGNPDYNLQLSNARATNVMRELVALGVSADRIEAEGYGEQHPVASNESEAGRAQNRRIALRVTQR